MAQGSRKGAALLGVGVLLCGGLAGCMDHAKKPVGALPAAKGMTASPPATASRTPATGANPAFGDNRVQPAGFTQPVSQQQPVSNANFANNPIVQPEHVNAYEAGFKGSTSDGSFSFAAAAFLAGYSNLQVQANRTDPVTGIANFQPTNAGKSQTKGIEVEATLRPSQHFSDSRPVSHL